MEQRPRAQSRGEVIALEQGAWVILPTRYRPVAGTRGCYRAAVRHGVSRIREGTRDALGVIFHDAQSERRIRTSGAVAEASGEQEHAQPVDPLV